MKLTEKIIAGLELPAAMNERLFSDDGLTGLSYRLRRGAKGGIAKSWVYRYTVAGTPRKLTLDFAGHSLAEARKLVGDLQARVRLGHDPAQERAQTAAEIAQTVEAVLRTYLQRKKMTLRPRSYDQVERHLLTNFAALHRLPLRAVALGDVTARYLAIATDNGRTTAGNALRSAAAFFAWALRQGLIDGNPCIGVERFPERSRERVLDASEIKAIWQATADATDYSAIVRLLLLTGCRASEIGSLEWCEVFSDRIVLPAERVKNNRQHTIPLTPTMRAIIEGRPRRPGKDHLFGRPGDRPFTGWGRSKQALDARITAAGIVMAPWVLHDLRRTLATGVGELGVAPHIIEAALNHTGFRRGVAGTYNRSQLEGPVRHALATWDAHVAAIVEGRIGGDRVVPLRA